MKRILCTLLLLGSFGCGAFAQEVNTTTPEVSTLVELGRTLVEEVEAVVDTLRSRLEATRPQPEVALIHSSAQPAIDKYNAQTAPKESYQGYRIRIFSGHSQSARTDAEAAISLFEEHFRVPVYFTYENPYFLVTCGNFLSHEEAIMFLSRARHHFPKAFIVTTEIPAEALLTPPVQLSAAEEEVTTSQSEDVTTEQPTTEPQAETVENIGLQ